MIAALQEALAMVPKHELATLPWLLLMAIFALRFGDPDE